jgi:hypothetical protein
MKLDKYIFVENVSKTKLKNLLEITANYYHKKGLVSESLVFHSNLEPKKFIVYFKSNPSFKQFKILFNFFSKIASITKTARVRAYWTIAEADTAGMMSQSFLIGKRIMLFRSPKPEHKDGLLGATKNNNDVYKFGFTDNYDLEEIRDASIHFEEKDEYYINKFVHLFTVISSAKHVAFKGNKKVSVIIIIAVLFVNLIIGLIFFLTSSAG